MDRSSPRKIACLLGCPDENDLARLCIAYDGDGDDLAACDVLLMRKALARHGFETYVVPRRCKSDTDVVRYVRTLFAACDRTDEVLFYFTGHGRRPEREFQLVLSETEWLSGHQLLAELRRCQARDKLLILDCCFGGVIEDLTSLFPEQSPGLRILVAATGMQRALHDPEIYGSYFSHFLCEALTDIRLWGPPTHGGLADTSGNLDSNALIAWLQGRLTEIAGRYVSLPTAIPTPLAFPRLPQGFTVLRLNLNQPLGYPDHLQHALRSAIYASAITGDALAASYAWCVARQRGHTLPEPETLTGPAAIIDTLLAPVCFYLGGDALRLPVISFVAHLNQGLASDNPLDRWLRTALAWLLERSGLPRDHLNEAQRVDTLVAVATSQTWRPPCLLIEVADPAHRGRFQVSWDAIDALGETRYKADRGAAVDYAGLPGALSAVLPTALEKCRGARIELALPAALLTDDALLDRLERLACWDGVDTAAPGPLAPGHLAHQRPFALRCWERWGSTAPDAERYGGWRVRQHWQDRGDCLDRPAEQPCLAWLDSAGKTAPATAARRLLLAPQPDQRPLALGLRRPLTPAQCEQLLHTGAPILLWPRHQALTARKVAELMADLKARCASQGLARLPLALHEYRQCAADCGPAPALLWDTPEHLKYQPDPYDPDLMFEAPP